MDDEALKQKYTILLGKLYGLKNMINNSLEEYDELFSITKSGITIDNEVDGCNIFVDIKNNLNHINKSLVNEIIPKVNNKI